MLAPQRVVLLRHSTVPETYQTFLVCGRAWLPVNPSQPHHGGELVKQSQAVVRPLEAQAVQHVRAEKREVLGLGWRELVR